RATPFRTIPCRRVPAPGRSFHPPPTAGREALRRGSRSPTARSSIFRPALLVVYPDARVPHEVGVVLSYVQVVDPRHRFIAAPARSDGDLPAGNDATCSRRQTPGR